MIRNGLCSMVQLFRSACFISLLVSSVLVLTIQVGQSFAQPMASFNPEEHGAYDDGPHVWWENDSTALIFYLCDETLDTTRISVSDTLRFAGRCHDRDMNYAVPREFSVSPAVLGNVSRIFAMSDIHGEAELAVELLSKAGVIDVDRHWSWGDGHLVIVGDIFDRGIEVTECLWLIYRLEQEASLAGGRVHFLLGNHELMVLTGDNRYIHEKYTKGIVRKSRFRHRELYGPDMAMGRWLRSRNTMISINSVLFVHGGISTSQVERELSIQTVNDSARVFLDLPAGQRVFGELPRFLFGSTGPFWYRGYHYDVPDRYDKATADEVDRVLSYYGADAIVVGHTGVDHVSRMYDGNVFAIDIPTDVLLGFEGLLWQGGEFFRVTTSGEAVQFSSESD